MARCEVDPGLERMRSGELSYPLGVYPVEPSQARAGYTVEFEPADSGEDEQDAQWEEWPDRYAYEVVISADRLEALTRAVIGLLPSRVYDPGLSRTRRVPRDRPVHRVRAGGAGPIHGRASGRGPVPIRGRDVRVRGDVR